MEKRMLLLVNPNAGKGGYKTALAGILRDFCDGGWQPTVFFTKASGEAPEIIRQHAPGYDMVVCLGGDGTLSEVCAGMMRMDGEKKPIGYIPLGTANDVARTLGLSPKPRTAARSILTGKRVAMDIGRFGEDNYFTYIAAFGAFTEVSYGTPQESKQALGHMAYMLEGLRRLPDIRDYRAVVHYDDGAIVDDFIFGAVTNSTSVAGLVKLDADEVSLSDGLFEVILVRKPQNLLDTGDIISSILSSDFSGANPFTDFSGPNVLYLKSREVRFSFTEPVAWTRDGESGGSFQEVCIRNCSPGVEIIV